jgi:hypothetical protein
VPELTKAEARTFATRWLKDFRVRELESQAPGVPSRWRLDRDAREAKRGIIAGIAWAEDGRAMADVELVLKVTGLYHSTADEHCRFDEILADDEELAIFYNEHWCTPRWYGWIAGVRAVVSRHGSHHDGLRGGKRKALRSLEGGKRARRSPAAITD